MNGHDPELEQLREAVSCAALLEHLPPPWKLDRAESSRNCLKYRRGKGEIIIVNHGGRGWWDAGGTAKGDVFDLVRHLQPDLNFGHVRKLLRDYVGLQPTFTPFQRDESAPADPAPQRWKRARSLRPGSRVWRYLAEARALPARILHAARAWDVVREGGYGSAWFGHRDHSGLVTGFEIRSPNFRGFAKGSQKALFRLPGWAPRHKMHPRRIAVAEAPIDALSLAARERLPATTLYVATGGGMGPLTVEAIGLLLADIAADAEAALVAATDNDLPGERYADMLAEYARGAGVAFERLRPPHGLKDWNDVLKRGRGE